MLVYPRMNHKVPETKQRDVLFSKTFCLYKRQNILVTPKLRPAKILVCYKQLCKLYALFSN